MSTATHQPTEPTAPAEPGTVDGLVDIAGAGEPRSRRKARLRAVAVWPYQSVRRWIDRRRKVIDLRDRGLNAGVGLSETATRPGEPEDPAASVGAPATDTTD